MPAPAGRRLFYLFALLTLALLVNAGMVWQQTLRLIDANEESRRQVAVTTLLQKTLQSVLEAEAGQRGYVIAGDKTYLDPYQKARYEIEGHLRELDRLAVDNAELTASLDEIEQLIAAKFDELEASIRVREQQGLTGAARLVRSHEGKRVMDRLRQRIRELETDREQVLHNVTAEVDRVATATLYGNIFASLLGVCLVIVVAWMSWRDTRERESSARQLEEINRRLAATVGEMEHRNQEMQQLSRLSNYLQSSETPEEIFEVLTATLKQLFPHDSGGMYELTPSHDYLELRARWGDGCPDDEQVIAPEDCWALRRGRPYRVGEGAPGPLCNHVRRTDVAGVEDIAYSCLPIVAQSEIIGLLHIR